MAEDDSGQEKTEDPTEHRLKKAREDGQIPRSKEMMTTAVLLAGCIGLFALGGYMSDALQRVFVDSFSLEREEIFDTTKMLSHLTSALKDALLGIGPLLVILFFAAFFSPLGLGGWLLSTKALAPKLNRLDPVGGIKRMFSLKSLVELAKAIGKVLLVALGTFFLYQMLKNPALGLAQESLESAISHAVWLVLIAAILLSAITILIVMMDVPFQIYDNKKKLKMSMQDIKLHLVKY